MALNLVEKLWAYLVIWPLAQLYRLTLQSLWNAGGNLLGYAAITLDDRWQHTSNVITQQQDKILVAASQVPVLSGLRDMLSSFVYKFDGLVAADRLPLLDRWPTWTQAVRVHVYHDFSGNCQDSAHFTRWVMKTLNSDLTEDRRWKYRLNIYTPINPGAWDKVHYFVSIKSPQGEEYQVSNGKISQESRDALAIRYLKSRHKYIWLTPQSWRD